MNDRITGRVKWWNDAKGFGYITPDDGGLELFAHFSQIQTDGYRTLSEHQKVSFIRTQDPVGNCKFTAKEIKPHDKKDSEFIKGADIKCPHCNGTGIR